MRGGEPVDSGQVDVEYGDVGKHAPGGGDHLVAALELGGDLEVVLELDQRAQRAAHQMLIFG